MACEVFERTAVSKSKLNRSVVRARNSNRIVRPLFGPDVDQRVRLGTDDVEKYCYK